MVKITEELIRKKSEHNECIIGTLEELSLHQEDVDKIEHIHNWCKELQILYLQANLINKIENLSKLKKLQYLNLAINNIEKVENLEKCESLEKLDLTLNFIGDLQSICSLKPNFHLRSLYLTGNPCSDYEGYRNYVIAELPQITSLDNVEVTRSERIKALQILHDIKPKIKKAEWKYELFRTEQIERLSYIDQNLDDDIFWNASSEHAPETRVEISRRSRLNRGKDVVVTKEQKALRLFTKEGRPLNINHAKMQFKFDESDPSRYVLEVSVYKYLDTSHIEVDVQPIFVKILIKGKLFQFVLPEEVYTDKSIAQRSEITGHLVITMPRVNYVRSIDKRCKTEVKDITENIDEMHDYLEIEPTDETMDFSKIIENMDNTFKDNEEVPPLEYAYF